MNDCFYLIGRSSSDDGGIYQYRVNHGVPEQLSFTPLKESSWICRSPDGQFMYATWREGGDQGCAAFRVGKDGRLEFLNRMSSAGKSPCHACVSPDGKFLYCANYRSGSTAEFRLASDGAIGEMTKLIRHSGSGPVKERQDGPHAHFTGFSPDGKFLLVIDLGIDAIKIYPFSDSGAEESRVRTFSLPPGSGPRHLVFNKAGTTAYLVNELSNTVMTLSWNPAGDFTLLDTVSTLPETFTQPTKAAAIRLSPDERFLYVSNRGYDTIACYGLDAESRFPVFKGFAAAGGIGPRDINYLPGHRKFAAADEFSDVVVFYDVNPESGMMTPDLNLVRIPGPLAIFW